MSPLIKMTWPYGTRRPARVLTVERTKKGIPVLFVEDLANEGEAHVLVRTQQDLPAEGEVGEIVFTKGGPTGGYWKFERRVSA